MHGPIQSRSVWLARKGDCVPIKKPLGRNSLAAQRELVELAKTLNLAEIVKRTGRTSASILIAARRLGISIKGRK